MFLSKKVMKICQSLPLKKGLRLFSPKIGWHAFIISTQVYEVFILGDFISGGIDYEGKFTRIKL